MRFIAVLLCAFPVIFAQVCRSGVNCFIEDGCVCASGKSPLEPKQTPQFVVLTFEDAANLGDLNDLYRPIFHGRRNPDSSKIRATFFVPHEYTDYVVVNELYNNCMEIGSHSITKREAGYWKNADLQTLINEFNGQREIIANNSNITLSEIRGARVPYLQLAGDELFQAYQQSGISYDSTWVALSDNKLFPYNLDYKSNQKCVVGECPTNSYPGFWISPVNNLKGNGSDCNSMLGCQIYGTSKNISNWLTEQFNATYYNQRAPFKLLLSAGWLRGVENSTEATNLFLDHLSTLKDVYIVNEWEVIEWRRNPQPLGSYKLSECQRNIQCVPQTCAVKKGEEIRYMRTCARTCPSHYPWINDTEGGN